MKFLVAPKLNALVSCGVQSGRNTTLCGIQSGMCGVQTGMINSCGINTEGRA